MAKPKVNKLYFMSASVEWFEEKEGLKIPQFSWASEVIIARDDEWAQKLAFKSNHTFSKEAWKINASYSLEELKELLEGLEGNIHPLGAAY